MAACTGKKLQESCRKINGIYRKTDATRGEIVDRNGVGLVVNTTKYKIVLNKLYIEEDRLDGILLELADILTKTGDARTDSLPISVGSDGSCVYKTSREEDAEKLLSSDFLDMDRNTSADDCFDALLKRYKISDRLSLSQKQRSFQFITIWNLKIIQIQIRMFLPKISVEVP